jgi:hypothetical protein
MSSFYFNPKSKILDIQVEGLCFAKLPIKVNSDYSVFIYSKAEKFFLDQYRDGMVELVNVENGVIQQVPYRADRYIFKNCSFHEGFDLFFSNGCEVRIIGSKFMNKCKFTGHIDELIINLEGVELTGTLDLSECSVRKLIVKGAGHFITLPSSLVEMKLMSCPGWTIDVKMLPQLIEFQSDVRVIAPCCS